MRTDEVTMAFVSDDQSLVKSEDCSRSNRVKYLYSYGGKILPRPANGELRYVGGETRIMAADRNVTFAYLLAKLAKVLNCDVSLKCQLPGEDLDALVSINSDEELHSMLEEYDSLCTKLRVFLFPKPTNPCGVVAWVSGSHMKAEMDAIFRAQRISQTLQGLEKHLNPHPRIQFSGKTTKETSFRKTTAFNCMSRNPYYGGGLAGYRVYPQFLVQ